jgi:uncharacterized protein (TIGR02757 family)
MVSPHNLEKKITYPILRKKSEVSDSLLKEFLDEKYLLYNNFNFIENDPIQIPHLFQKKEDIEIAGFLAATLAWGNRKTIISNANKLLQWMDYQPHQFITSFSKADTKPFKKFVHRTFNGDDCIAFLLALQNIYKHHKGLENVFCLESKVKSSISNFKTIFFETDHLERTRKHVSDPENGSAAKRLNMYLRWMVRKDNYGVDFGIWKNINTASLYLPLDVHTGNISRKLGLLKREQNDWRAVEEISDRLREFDPQDPIKYDFALFGLGAIEGF